ncbi:hypothetical protein D3C87_1219320 [compost metagenome]
MLEFFRGRATLNLRGVTLGTSSFSEYLKFAESELQLPKGVIVDLPNEDHWTFIIKISAMVERSLNHILTQHLKEESLKELVIKQSLGAKVDLALGQKLIEGDDQKKLKMMARLRNKAAHHILFDFDEVFKEADFWTQYKSAFANVWNDPVVVGGNSVPNDTFIRENPRPTIFFGVIDCLAIAKIEADTQKLTKEAANIIDVLTSFKATKK